MTYSHEVEHMCVVKKGPNHGPAPIPEEGKWVKSKEIVDISGLTHGIGWCAPQQGACKLTLNVKEGIIQEALVETSRSLILLPQENQRSRPLFILSEKVTRSCRPRMIMKFFGKSI